MIMVSKPPQEKESAKDPMAANQKIMMYAGPILTVVVLFNLPAAIGLYWTVSNLFSIGQQFYINKKITASESV